MNEYPFNWKQIADTIKDKAGWVCERCKHPSDITTSHVLTVHHLDGNKANCAYWNLAALCQRCHLTIQGRVTMDQMFFTEILDVSEWFKPHLEGYLASKSAIQHIEGKRITSTPGQIRLIVADHFGVNILTLESRRRDESTAWARQVAMKMIKEFCPHFSSVAIGKMFQRDHGTVLHAFKSVDDRCAASKSSKLKLEELRAKLRSIPIPTDSITA